MTAVFALVAGIALWPERPAQGPGGDVAAVAHAAQTFLGTLTPELQKAAGRSLDDAERTQWNFVPGRYAGVELGALDAKQKEAAHSVLRAMLSVRGYAKTTAIVELENVLRDLATKASRDGSHRDPGRYSLLVCGEPAADGTFALRFQGHHVSLQLSVVSGQLASHTPQFLGTNPHDVPSADGARKRVLGAEEDLARAFLLLLDEAQLGKAVIAAEAPPDVLLGPGKEPAALGERRGLPWKHMNEAQRGVLWRLLEEYAHVLRQGFADAELARIREHGLDELSFAWAGGRERGQGHYYRIHGLHFAIEYDCTQDGANHVHTVWRDFERDFGGDPLRAHLEQQHGRK